MKNLTYILLFILLSCSKQEETHFIEFHGIYATPKVTFGNASYVIVNVNGFDIESNLEPRKGGMSSEPFEVPLGWNDINDIRIFDKEGNESHFVKNLSQLGELNGLVATGVPLRSKGNITLQVFNSK